MSPAFSVHRQRAHDLADDTEVPLVAAPTVPARAYAHQDASIGEVADLVAAIKAANQQLRHRGTKDLLNHLVTLPGEGWAQRWRAFEETQGDRLWVDVVLPDGTDARRRGLIGAVLGLMILDVVRPSYPWMRGSSIRFSDLATWRDPEDSHALYQVLDVIENDSRRAQVSLRLAAQIQGCTGKHLREITAEDLLTLTEVLPNVDVSRSGVGTLWRGLHQLGWIEHTSSTLPSRRRRGQLSCEELVALYGVDGDQGQVLVEYLKHRTAGLDYPSRRSVARNLVKRYWRDMLDHHPELTSFTITRAQAEAWKHRLRFNENGTPRRDPYPIMFVVRGFYLDVALWALQDSYGLLGSRPLPSTPGT